MEVSAKTNAEGTHAVPLLLTQWGLNEVYRSLLFHIIVPAPMKEQHILRVDEHETGRGRWKSSVKFDSIAAIKTDSQLEYSVKCDVVRSLEKEYLFVIYCMEVIVASQKVQPR